LVTVNGFGFTTGLDCRFGTSIVPATFVDSTQLRCTSPARASVTTDEVVQVDILRNGQLFVPGVDFTYYGTPNQPPFVLSHCCFFQIAVNWLDVLRIVAFLGLNVDGA